MEERESEYFWVKFHGEEELYIAVKTWYSFNGKDWTYWYNLPGCDEIYGENEFEKIAVIEKPEGY